jgi:hypothetical protein
MPLICENKYYVALIEIEVDPENQKKFIDEIGVYVEKHIKSLPGFVSASFHANGDGRKVFNYAQWISKESYDSFLSFNPEEAEKSFEQYVKSQKVTNPLHVTKVVVP